MELSRGQRMLSVLLLCISISIGQHITPTPLIKNIIVQHNEIIIQAHDLFAERYLKEDFFIRYNQDDVDVATLDTAVLVMPFLMNVLPLIWLSGEVWEIDELDDHLFYSLKVLKKICAYIYPNAQWQGVLRVKNLITHTIESKQHDLFVMPFSGGLDSQYTSLSYRQRPQLLVTVREHQGFLYDAQWRSVIKNVTEFAQYYGHKNVFVESNYQRFIKNVSLFTRTPGLSAGTSHGLGWVGIIAPLLVAQHCAHVKIASSLTWDYPLPKLLCPMVDNTIRFAQASVAHDGFDCTRVDKMEVVSHVFDHESLPYAIYVCQKNHNGVNCCRCEKCVRTISALMALGKTSFKEYGFNISLKQAKKRVKEAVVQWAKNYYWRLEALQKKIIEKKMQHSFLFLKWITEVPLLSKKTQFNFYELDTFVMGLTQQSEQGFDGAYEA